MKPDSEDLLSLAARLTVAALSKRRSGVDSGAKRLPLIACPQTCVRCAGPLEATSEAESAGRGLLAVDLECGRCGTAFRFYWRETKTRRRAV